MSRATYGKPNPDTDPVCPSSHSGPGVSNFQDRTRMTIAISMKASPPAQHRVDLHARLHIALTSKSVFRDGPEQLPCSLRNTGLRSSKPSPNPEHSIRLGLIRPVVSSSDRLKLNVGQIKSLHRRTNVKTKPSIQNIELGSAGPRTSCWPEQFVVSEVHRCKMQCYCTL